MDLRDITTKPPKVTDKLDALFSLQKEIMNEYYPIEREKGVIRTPIPVNLDTFEGQDFVRRICLRIFEELGELLSCLPPEGQIITIDGIKRISEVKEGESVLTHAFNFRRVKKIFTRPYKGELIKIQVGRKNSKGGIEIFLTPNHPILACKSPGYSSKLKRLPLKWIPAKEISTEHLVFLPVPFKTEIPSEKLIPSFLLIPEFFSFLGWYLSEGYIRKSSIVLYLGPKDNKSDIKESIKRCFPDVKISEKTQRGNVTVLSLSHPKLVEIMKRICPGSAKRGDKRLHYSLLFAPIHLQKELVKSYILGDGSIGKGIRCASTSITLLWQIQSILSRMGITSKICRKKGRTRNIRGKPVVSKDLFSLRLHRDSKNILFETNSQKSLRNFIFHIQTFKGNRKNWKFLCQNVSRVERVYYEGPVYNLHIGSDNSYVTPLCAVHNCLKQRDWKRSQFITDKDAFFDEVADLLHFVLELFIVVGLDPDSLYELFWKKVQVNLFRIRSGY